MDLVGLAGLMSDCPVPAYLVGGLGLAVRAPQFYRNHADIDLAVFTDDLLPLVDHLERHHYRLAEAIWSLPISPWHRIDRLRPVPRTELPNRLDRALRLQHSDNNYPYPGSRLALMDLLPMTATPAGVLMHGYGRVVPREDFFPTQPISGSPQLLLPRARYKRCLPSTWPRQRQDLDRLSAT